MSRSLLKLYIRGHTLRSERAITNMHRICNENLHGKFEFVVIDTLVLPQPPGKKLLATPTLVRDEPPPGRFVIGDMADPEKVLQGLGLEHYAQSNREEGKKR